MSDTPKRFKDLRVADLKLELEKRGLQTSGIKAILADRLKKALTDEGVDVEEFIFDKTGASKDAEKGSSDEEPAVAGDEKVEPSAAGDQPGVAVEKNGPAGDGAQKVDDHKEPEGMSENENKEKDEKETEAETENEAAEAEMENEEKEAEDDSLNIMVGDEDNLFGDEERGTNGVPASPPRPENVPAKHPFTSRDTLSLSSRGQRPPSENSSMRVNPDETQSVASHDSNHDQGKEAEEKGGEIEATAEDTTGKQTPDKAEAAKGSRTEADRAKTARPVVATARNLWVSGLSETTRAKDLKELFSKYGKVEGAKVVTNAKHAGARCYGFITMEKPEDAARCIENLNKRELHGNMILVESATADTGPSRSSASSRSTGDKSRAEGGTAAANDRHKSASKDSARKDDHQRHRGGSSGRAVSTSRGHSSGARAHSSSRNVHDARRGISGSRVGAQPTSHHRRPDDKGLAAGAGVLTFNQIKDQRKKELEREEERRRRERERRREEEEERRRKEAIRRQREEEDRLKREREELRKERERLEKEKQELMKFERERQRMEREKLEREKQELERLRRQQMSSRVMEERRPAKRMADDRDPYFDDRKRLQRDEYPAAGSSRGGGDRYDSHSGRSSRDLSGGGRGLSSSARDLGGSSSSRSLAGGRESGSSGHISSSRDLPGASFKGSSRDISGGGSGYMVTGSSRMGSSGHMGHSRSVSGGRDVSGSIRSDLGRSSGSDYGRNRDERSRAAHGTGSHHHQDGASNSSSRSNIIGAHASWGGAVGGSSSSSSGLSGDWGRGGSGSLSSDRGVAGGLPGRLTGMSNLSAMAMGVGVGVNPFAPALTANPFAGGALSGSLSGSTVDSRYDAYALKNPVIGTRRY